MMDTEQNNDKMIEIMSLMQDPSPNIPDLCDLIYHYNKSLGVTYTTIREEIGDLVVSKRVHALQNFLKVIEELRSPNLFIHIEDSD